MIAHVLQWLRELFARDCPYKPGCDPRWQHDARGLHRTCSKCNRREP